MVQIKNSNEINKLKKRINILLWFLVIFILIGLFLNWYALVLSMKTKQNFKHEKTRTYNSMHGLKDIEK
jgi:cell division septal protein FtsQ